jgi:hypothetical protein
VVSWFIPRFPILIQKISFYAQCTRLPESAPDSGYLRTIHRRKQSKKNVVASVFHDNSTMFQDPAIANIWDNSKGDTETFITDLEKAG